MHKDKLEHFLEGESDPKELDFDAFSIETDFTHSYQKVIEQSKTNIPDFNPFEKLDGAKRNRLTLLKQITPYAASILLAVSIFIFRNENKKDLTISDNELQEIQENTTLALLHFSRELNSCMTIFEETNSIKNSSKNFKIDKNNPFKNFKIN